MDFCAQWFYYIDETVDTTIKRELVIKQAKQWKNSQTPLR